MGKSSSPSGRAPGPARRIVIDRILGQTPCICGDTTTWHQGCYAGKSDSDIRAAQDRVYTTINRRLAKDRKTALAKAMKGTAHG